MREPRPEDVYVNVDDRTGIATYHIANALPSSVKGLACNDCGEPYAYVNANCSYEQQKYAYNHEMKHLSNDDFNSTDSADAIEKDRH